MKDIRQSPKYASYLKALGWRVDKISNNYFYSKKLFLIASVLKFQRPEKIDIKEIKKAAKESQALRIIVEPNKESDARKLKEAKYNLSNSPYLPTKTLLLDLTPPVSSLRKNLKKDARYSLRKTKDLITKEVNSDKISEFRNSWRTSVGLSRFVPPEKQLKILKSTFQNDCLFLIEGCRSGAIFLYSDKKAYYWQAFTNRQGRKNLSQYKIVWEGILWAKDKGAKTFDFEGIYDKRFPNKNWQGFTHFKKSFGGNETKYPGAFVKTNLPFLY